MIFDLTPIIDALIFLLAALITSIVVPWLKSKLTDEQEKELLRWAEIAVAAAEQLYSGVDPEKKKKHVLDYLERKGYEVDTEDIDNAIEAAVLKLHKELYGKQS